MSEIPERIWKAIPGFIKPQQGYRTNNDNVWCWKTVRKSDKKPVVIKLFEWAIIEEATAEITAVEALKKIDHKNLVRVFDVAENDDIGIYYVMECWGNDLRDTIQVKPDQQVTINIIKQVLEGLAELHRHKLAHRDIKPENIFIKGSVVKLGDYGLVKSQRFITQLTTIGGTQGYIAPEVLAGKPYDERCDIYSVGVVLRELLTGEQPPFSNPDNYPNDITRKAMAKEPKDRFQTTKEFISALRDLRSIDIDLNQFKKRRTKESPLSTTTAVSADESKQLIQPDWEWYSGISRQNNLPLNCPIANIYTCPRYYKCTSLLTRLKMISGITPEQDKYLETKWSWSQYYHLIRDEEPSINQVGEKDTLKLAFFTHFCPEVVYLVFGFFVSYAAKYADEQDLNYAHQRLAQKGINTSNWRWGYASVAPKHYIECKEYSFHISGKLQPIPTEHEDMARRSQHLQELMKKEQTPSSSINTDEIVNKTVEKLVTMPESIESMRLQHSLKKLRDKGKSAENVPIFQEIKSSRYPPKPNTGQGYGIFAETLKSKLDDLSKTGDLKTMLPVAEEFTKAVETELGRKNSRTADAYEQLADIYLGLADYTKAAKSYETAQEIDYALYGQRSYQWLYTRTKLGHLYRLAGDYRKAVEYYHHTSEVAGQFCGGSSNYAVIQNNLAGMLYLTEDYQTSIRFLQEALWMNEKTVGKFSEEVVINLINLSLAYQAKDDSQTATTLKDKAIYITKTKKDPNSKWTISEDKLEAYFNYLQTPKQDK